MDTRAVSALLAIALSLHTGSALAAETQANGVSPYGDRDMENIDLTNAYAPSPLYVLNLHADETPGTDGLIHGTFVAQNAGDDIVPDITYRIDLYGAAGTADADTLMDRVQGGVFFAVAPHGTQSIDFTYKPLLPTGTYTLRIQLLSGNGRPFGWGDAFVMIANGANAYVQITPGAILMPEYEHQPLEPLTGPNVDAESSFSIGASFHNPGSRSMTVVPTVHIYEFDSSQSRVDTVTYDPVTLAAGETRTLTLPITAGKRPEVYFAELTAVQQGTRVSGLAEYRWVVRGQDANIIAARIETLGLKKDDHTFIRVDYAGPADAETKLRGSLHVTLHDDQGILGELTVHGVELADEIGSGIARIKLTRDMVGSPSIEVSITDNNDTVLAHYGQSSTISHSTLQTIADNGIAKQWFRWFATPHALLTIFLLAAAAIACALLVRFMSSLSSSRGAVRVLSALLVTAMMLHTSSALANGITVVQPKTFLQGHPDWHVLGNRPAVELFINKPVHDAPSCTYSDLTRVPFEYRVDFGVCLNRPAVVRVIARYDKNGGKHSNIEGSSQSDWKEVHDEIYREQTCGAYFCVTSKNYSGTVDLSGVNPNATSTTLQVAAKWTWNGQFTPNDEISQNAEFIRQDHDSVAAHVVNLWVNLCPANVDLRIQKTAPATVVRGNNLTYSLLVQNLSNGTASNVTITDPIPSGLTYIPASSDNRCSQQGNNVVCSFSNPVGPQESRTVNLTFATSPTMACDPGTITNTATVHTSTTDTNAGNNVSTATTQVNCPQVQNPDVQMQKSGPNSVTRGSTFTYTLTATNVSQVTATNVVVTDIIPNGLTYVSSSNDCSINGNVVTCNAGTINAGQNRTFTITVSSPAVATGQTCSNYPSNITNTATVTATNDSNAANNQSAVTTQITCTTAQNPDVQIVKTGPSSVTRGTSFSYTLSATNIGQETATNVVVTDIIPNGLTYVSSSNDCSINGNVVTCNAGTINAGQNRTFTITVSSPAVATGQTCSNYPSNITNTATVTATNDSNAANNQSSVTTQITCTTANEGFTISKTDHRSTAEAGDTLTYEITVKNVGSTRQTNVTVTDILPRDVEFIDASPNEDDEDGREITWEDLTFEAGETKIFEVEVEIDDDFEGTLTNIARVRNEEAEDRTRVEDEDDEDDDEDVEIELTKMASTSEVFPGGIIDYTVTVENTGDDTIEDLLVRDMLPADVIVIDDGDADDRNGRTLEWEIDELDEDDTVTFRYRVSVPTFMVPGQTIRNDVRVTNEDDDIDERASVTVIVIGTIPQTGMRGSVGGNHLTPMHSDSSSSQATLPFLASIALAGVGTGVGVARRKLFGL